MRVLSLVITLLSLVNCQNILSQKRNIKVTSKRNPDKSVDISYDKTLPGSYYIMVEFSDIENCSQSDFNKVIKYNSGKLVTLKPIDFNEHINFSYSYSYIRGHPNPKVDENFTYVLPFKKGEHIKIYESTNLKETYFNAKKDLKWKSFVVDRDYADTIYNMRKGIVVDIKAKYKTTPSDTYVYTSKMNSVTVEHKDGTVSRYIGFKKESIFVKLGQTVYPQTKLGALDIFNDSTYRLYFDVAYLKKVDFDEKKLINSESQREHVTPLFFSSNGSIKLNHNKVYTVEINESVLFEEFTKKEKKKYKNSPQIFE